jgi:predicted ATPase
MIEKYNNSIQLVDRSTLVKDKNIFTILVGKNGTGKSTLLGDLTSNLIREISNHRKHSGDLFQDDLFQDGFFPSEIIAVSTSPFDKFPVDRFFRFKNYTYLGLRDLLSSNVGIAYLSKIIASLVESVSKQEEQAFEISKVLNYLGYKDEIWMHFQFSNSKIQLSEFANTSNLRKYFENRDNISMRRINRLFFLNKDDSINERKLIKLRDIIREVLEGRFPPNLEIVLNRYGLNIGIKDSEDILFLIHCGILKLRDVRLRTTKDDHSFSIKDASSGEQSIILSILGIASKIKNNCLICIDEPEICLHPQWQEKYIEILTTTFDNYRNCHFLIATHSPLIVSRLSSVNSYIVDMEFNSITNAESVTNHSSDFQLANVFGYPGFKNEYLARIALNTFSKVSKYKAFDSEDLKNFDTLEKQSTYLKHNDPVYDLFITLSKLKKLYA